MVITAAQQAAFFSETAQMAIPLATIPSLQQEGITTVGDLLEFDEDTISSIASNFRRSTPMIVFGAKSQKRLTVACYAVKFYDSVNRPITAGMMQWDPVLKNFSLQYEAMKAQKDETEPDTPRISKALPVMKWAEAFRDVLHRCVGVRDIPLAYVIRELEVPPVALPPLATGMPHSTEAGSVQYELISRASHAHPNYRSDNDKVYGKMEEATRSTSYAASIKPFQRLRNGRAAYMAIINQYAGADKWTLEITKFDSLLHNDKWKGTGSYTLERFCASHRNAMEQLRLASNHVPYQLPEEHTRVGYLLDAIETTDSRLQAALSNVRADMGQGGKRSDFEATVAFITPEDPVARRFNNRKRGAASISDVDAAQVNISALKPGKGKTGVHLRYHVKDEYDKLTRAQKKELYEWRTTPEGKAAMDAGKAKAAKSDSKKQKSVSTVSALVSKAVDEKLKSLVSDNKANDKKRAETKAAVVGALEEILQQGNDSSLAQPQLAKGKEYLRSILKKKS